jgi:hypothetical protein
MNKKRLIIVISVIVLCIMIAIGYHLFFSAFNIGIPCPLHELFGVNCPGCGLSRMLFSIMELKFYQAFRYNPLMFIYLPIIALMALDFIVAYIHERKTKVIRKVPVFVWGIMITVALVFGVVRNIEPFTFLAPIELGEVKENSK